MKARLIQLFFIALVLVSAQILKAQCACSPENIIPSNANNVTINNGEMKCFVYGTFTGNITINTGGTLCISSGATFQPQNFNQLSGKIINHGTLKTGNLNNFNGTIENYGTFTPQQSFSFSSGGKIDNYGKFYLNNSLNFNGSATIINEWEGRIYLSVDFNLNNNSLFENYGITVSTGSNANFTHNNSTFNNYGELRVLNGNFNSQGTLLNEGMIYAGNKFNINGGTNVLNNCRLVANKGFQNGAATFVNDGLLWASNADPSVSHIQLNSGIFTNGENGQVRGTRFTNNATVKGSGQFYMTEVTTNQGPWTGTVAGDPIRFFDLTQTGSQIFDFQNQNPSYTIRPNSMIPPDTLSYGNICTNQNYRDLFELHYQIPLPISLRYFTGHCDNGVVELQWIASQELNISGYHIERSGDGKNWEVAGVVNAQGADNRYNFTVTSAGYRYFRLAVQEEGYENYSNVITVSCEGAIRGIATSVNPNPNNGAFNISFGSPAEETVHITITNAQSGVVYSANAKAVRGVNNFSVNLSDAVAGFYVVSIRDKAGNTSFLKFIVE